MNSTTSSILSLTTTALAALLLTAARAANSKLDGASLIDGLGTETLSTMLAPSLEEEAAITAFFEHYVLAPNPGEALDLLPTVDAMIGNHPTAASSMTGIYTGIIATSPEHVGEWRALLDASPPLWLEAAIHLGLADPEVRKKALYPAPEKTWRSSLELLWGWYFATGDAEAPEFIIRCGGSLLSEGEFPDSTQTAAAWSAKSLAREHSFVAAKLEAYVLSATDAELRAFFRDADGVAPVRGVLSPAAITRLDALFAP